MTDWITQVLYALDRLANAAIRGSADEFLSSRAHRMREKGQRVWGWTANAIDWLWFWETDHCRKAYDYETARLTNPPWGKPKPNPYYPPGADPETF